MRDNHMEKRLAQLAWVMERIDTHKEVGTLQLADAVQLCDERFYMEEVTKWDGREQVRLGWEMLKLNPNGTHAGGAYDGLFPTIRSGFVWLGRQLLAHPPREKQGMFPYFNVFTGVVVNDQPHVPRHRNRSKPKYASESGAYEEVLSTKEGDGPRSIADARGHRGAIGLLLGEKRDPYTAKGPARTTRTKRGGGPVG